MPKHKPQRAGVTKADGKQVIVWFDPAEIRKVDNLATKLDLDRSKFIRRAVKTALAQLGA
jgi:predicted transcriptional regulator